MEARSKEDPALRQSRLKKSLTTEQREHIYRQMRQWFAGKGMNPDAAFYAYKELFGVQPANTFRSLHEPVTPENAAIFGDVCERMVAAKRQRAEFADRVVQTKKEESYGYEELELIYRMMRHYASCQTKTGNANQAFHWYREMFDGAYPRKTWNQEPLEPDDETLELIENHIAKKRREWYAKNKNRRHHS